MKSISPNSSESFLRALIANALAFAILIMPLAQMAAATGRPGSGVGGSDETRGSGPTANGTDSGNPPATAGGTDSLPPPQPQPQPPPPFAGSVTATISGTIVATA